MIVVVGFAAPLVAAAGALAPTFPFLVATQTIGRPLGLALDFLVAVVAAEEMPRSSRGLRGERAGDGQRTRRRHRRDLAAARRPRHRRLAPRLRRDADLVARSPSRSPATCRRPSASSAVTSCRHRSTVAASRVLAAVAVLGNLFIAPASLFQNGYLEDERGYSAALIAAFTLATATPAGIGLIVGGRVADVRGRRRLIAVCVPVAATLLVISYSVGGPPMWLAALVRGDHRGDRLSGARRVPQRAVPDRQPQPGLVPGHGRRPARRHRRAGDDGRPARPWAHPRRVLGGWRSAQLLVVAIVLRWFPETAHRELEDLNPIGSTTPSLTAPPHLGTVRVTPTSGEDPCQRLTRIFPRSPMASHCAICNDAAVRLGRTMRREPRWANERDADRLPHLPAVRGQVRARDHAVRRRRSTSRASAATATTCSATASSAPRARRSSSSTRTPTGCARRWCRRDGEFVEVDLGRGVRRDRAPPAADPRARTAATPSPSTSATRTPTTSPGCSTAGRCSRRSAPRNLFSASTVDQRPKEISAALMFGGGADRPGARPRPHRLPADARRQPVRVERQPGDRARLARAARGAPGPGRQARRRRPAPHPHRRGGRRARRHPPRHRRLPARRDGPRARSPRASSTSAPCADLRRPASTSSAPALAAVHPRGGRRRHRHRRRRRSAGSPASWPPRRRPCVYGRIGTTTAEFGTRRHLARRRAQRLHRQPRPARRRDVHHGRRPAGQHPRHAARRPRRALRPPPQPGARPARDVRRAARRRAWPRRSTRPGEGQIRALVTVAGNPVLSTPNGGRLDAALGRARASWCRSTSTSTRRPATPT